MPGVVSGLPAVPPRPLGGSSCPAPILLALLLVVAHAVPCPALQRLQVGEEVEDFSLVDFDGGVVRLGRSLGRKATVVVFWATWSPRSAEALAELQKLYRAHGPDDLRVVAVNVEHETWEPGEFDRVAAYVGASGLTFPVVVDVDFTLYARYGVTVLPSLVLVDVDRRVAGVLTGYPQTPLRDEFRKAIVDLVAPNREPRGEPSN